MTKKQWNSFTKIQRIEYIYYLGWKSRQGSRAGKAADKKLEQIISWIIKEAKQ